MELEKVTTPPIPGKTVGEAIGTFTLGPEKPLEISHWDPGKIVDLSASPPAGKKWFVTINVHVVESDSS